MKGKNIDFSAGGNQFKTEITANPTADRVLTLPDRSSTLVTTNEIAPTLLFANHSSSTITGVTTEQTFTNSNYTIPANTLQIGDVVFVSALWTFTGSTNAKFLFFRLNSSAVSQVGLSSAGNSTLEMNRWLRVRSATEIVSMPSAGWQGGGSSGGVANVISTNIANSIILLASGRVDVASEFIRLESIFLQISRVRSA